MRQRRTAGAATRELAPYVDAILVDEHVVIDAPQAAVDEARDSAQEADPDHVPDPRGDATDLEFVTVDPPGSRDLDQALHVERRRTGFRLRYAIADVGAHVRPGGALDALAHARGATVYCPDRRIGLHPPELSEGHASLLAGQRTKAVLWTIDIDEAGNASCESVERVWVRSRRQYDYRELDASTDSDDAKLRDLLAQVGQARRSALRRQGGVTLPLPEQDVVERDGRLSLAWRAAVPLEDDNAQLSLATGMVAAHLMLGQGVGILRTMPPASQEAMDRLRLHARALGIDWPAEVDYAGLLDTLDATTAPALAFLTAATRLFRGAQWEPFRASAGDSTTVPAPVHGALGAPYAHVTAPLRRLVDRYATEAALAAALGRPLGSWAVDGLDRAAADTATGARRASAVERRCVDAVESLVLAPRVGERFQAIGLDDRTIQLLDPPVVERCEGDVPPGEPVTVELVEATPPRPPSFRLEPAPG